MTLEEFACTLSTRSHNVMLNLVREGWVHFDDMILYIETPRPTADIKDVFRHMTRQRLLHLNKCGEKSADEIIKALAKHGVLLKASYHGNDSRSKG